METGAMTQTVTLATTFHKTAGEANKYLVLGYGPLTICNHIQGKDSGLLNADTINRIDKIQQ